MTNAEEKKLRSIATRRLRLITVTSGEDVRTSKKKICLLAELASLGYKVGNADEYNDSALEHYKDLIDTLKDMKGGKVEYVPLFQGFPNDVPDQNEYFVKRIMGFIGNFIWSIDEGRELDNGMKVPEWLFDLSEFGADPITQFQDRSLFEAGVRHQKERKGGGRIQWVSLKFAGWSRVVDEARKYLLRNLYSKSSIKESLKGDIEFLLDFFGTDIVDPNNLTFKETRTYVQAYFWKKDNLGAVKVITETPTDLLRLFASLTETDVSLAQLIKFPKFNRGQRRFVLEVLEGCSNLVEDLNSYKGLWLEIGRFLHPGEYKRKFPKTAGAFNVLRNEKITTYNGKVELAAKAMDAKALVELLKQRPGVFARKIHHALEIAGQNYRSVLRVFEKATSKVSLKNLLVLESHMSTIESAESRAVINKKGQIRVLENRPGRLAPGSQKALVSVISKAINKKINSEKPAWSGLKVWIDKGLRNYTVPLQQRKASDGLMTLGRGSQIPLEDGKILRLFVYWKDNAETRTDLDLSLINFDEDMSFVGQVSYTNLNSQGIVHSGDLQSAPHGAAEFIDVNLEKVRKKGCRYIASQIYKYAGSRFSEIDCHAGWMIRDRSNNEYKSFDIKTVQNKFDLNGNAGYAIPIIVDLKENKIIFVDIYVGNRDLHSRVEGAVNDVSSIAREATRMLDTRPNLHQLAQHNAVGREGELVESKDDADVTLGISDCDYNAQDVEKILSELI